MPKYYLTGTSSRGERKTHEIEANSVDQAQQKLLAQGWDEIVVHTDDIYAMMQTGNVPAGFFAPEETIRLGSMSPLHHFLMLLRKIYRQSATLLIISILAISLGCMGEGWFPWAWGLVLLLLPILLAFVASFGNLAKLRYEALVAAAGWYRWDEVERLLPLQSSSLSRIEIAYRAAEVLAGRGDVQAAIQKHDAMLEGHNSLEWFTKTRHAALYLIAIKVDWANSQAGNSSRPLQSRYIEDATRKFEEAAQIAPDESVPLIDMAKVVIKYQRNARRARELLERSQGLVATELGSVFRNYIYGMIALEENSADKAVELISAFEPQLSRITTKVAAEAVIDESRAFLTLAHAMAGHDEQARQQFRLCEPRLIAVNELDLLLRCRQALGMNQR